VNWGSRGCVVLDYLINPSESTSVRPSDTYDRPSPTCPKINIKALQLTAYFRRVQRILYNTPPRYTRYSSSGSDPLSIEHTLLPPHYQSYPSCELLTLAATSPNIIEKYGTRRGFELRTGSAKGGYVELGVCCF